jgi:hypothetical protein
MLTKMFNFEANYLTNQYSRKLETLISRKFHFQWGLCFEETNKNNRLKKSAIHKKILREFCE